MVSIVFYFQAHQPYRVKNYPVFNIGNDEKYFNSNQGKTDNKAILKKVSEKSYLPSNKMMLELLNKHPEFKLSYSISGVLLEQLEKHEPKVLESFQDLYDTGRVELLNETYYHSLSFIHSEVEFLEQVKMHQEKIKELFGAKPTVFRNTELVYNNDVAKMVEKLGYKATMAEGWDKYLGWRSPNFVYKAKDSKTKLLFRNYKLSDDMSFRFSSKDWKEWPLTSEKFSNWINQANGGGEVINLFLDYETFGEHQWTETGIFDFVKNLPNEILKHPDNEFLTPSQAVDKYQVRDEVDIPHYLSWADVDRDLSAWIGNQMQQNALHQIFQIENDVKNTKDIKLLEKWRKLTTSDHFYYMCTKWFNDGDVHKYFSPYDSPYTAYFNFMNAMKDLKSRVYAQKIEK